ncbi:MAG: J domain-containing protein, partial [Pseudanabaenaceae cyanobacterium bins.68]|nr:J domain-containing protein [Pseudanabaenaceae cyanobacterium bins.68]
MESSKSFKLTRGLAVKDVVDHYAVLGLPITCEVEEIRNRFKALSKSLHPDVYSLSTVQRGWATQYYAKLVTPAYKILDNDASRNEYFATLRYLAIDLKKSEHPPTVQSEWAQKLVRFAHEVNYRQYVAEVAAKQYLSLSKVVEYTNELSEINLIFLYTQAEISQPIRIKVVAPPISLPPLPQISPRAQPKIQQAE